MKRGVRARARWAAAVVVVGLCGSAPALGQDAQDDMARRHFESGVAYLQESDYESALKAFQKAYELSKRPEILLNIATVQERRGNLKAAVESLEQFVKIAPTNEQRPTAETRITNLKKRIEAEEAGDAGAGSTPTESDAGAVPGPPTGQPVPPTKDDEAKPPNIPAYVLLGLGGLAAGGAVLTGILAKGEYDDAEGSCSPNCTDDQVSSGRTLALTSTILTGVAVVSAGVGAVLLLSGDSKEKAKRTHLPVVGIGIAPGGAAASAAWRF